MDGELDELQQDLGEEDVDASCDEVTSQLAERMAGEMGEIEDALARFREGTYGQCEDCGRTIPIARLQAKPTATTCVACQERRDRLWRRPSSRSGRQRMNWSAVDPEPPAVPVFALQAKF